MCLSVKNTLSLLYVTLEVMGTPGSVSHRLDSQPVGVSSASIALLADVVEVVPAIMDRLVVWPGLKSPLPWPIAKKF